VTPPGTQQPDVEIEVPARAEYVGVVRHLMGAVARLGQHSPEFVENAKLAGSEACTNAVMLMRRAGADGRIEVRAAFDDEQLQIEVADRGEPATEVVSVLASDPETPVTGLEGGLSLPLLEGLVDELAIEDREGGGNVIRLTLIRELVEGSG